MTLDLLGLRHDVFAGDLPGEVGVIVTQMLLRLLPEFVVVVTLDDRAAHTVDPLHRERA
jgi:hypothetical protein